eukprot:TCALIF_11032-PA protein Name:"Similar to Uncharacterized protein C4orf29 homolog (Mus musculus)" AED:0.08 eAED:0.11 QI:77/0.5/0.33/1/1/1/3/129/655
MKRIFAFRRQLADRQKAVTFVDPNHPLTITKKESFKDHHVIEGHFLSPCAQYLPELLPVESHTAYFQMVLPKDMSRQTPMVIQYAGTGDHFFWRRRKLMALPMVSERGVGSIILENAFYGLRKPKDQLRSSLRNVTDLFVMGAANIMETLVLFHMCQRENFWPVVTHGISMGGHMASLSATVIPQAVGVVPCLALTSASPTFTQGVMASAIPWHVLEEQYSTLSSYRDEIARIVKSEENAFQAGIEFAQTMEDESISGTPFYVGGQPRVDKTQVSSKIQMAEIFRSLQLPFMGLFNRSKALSSDDKLKREAVQFMRGIMDECTHLKNFDVPVDPSLCVSVSAEYDAYQPQGSIRDVPEIWPGATSMFVPGTGHVGSYLFKQKMFRGVIYEVIDKMKHKEMLSSLKVLTLDLTGTVYRFTKPPFLQYQETAKEYNIVVNENDVKQAFKANWSRMNENHPHFGSTTHHDSTNWWMDLVHGTFEDVLGSSYQKHEIQPIALHLYNLYSTTSPFRVYPDSWEFLHRLKKVKDTSDLKVGLITNFDRRIVKVIQQLGVRPLVDFLVYSEGAQASKPDVNIFELALKKSLVSNVRPSEALHVGDDADKDYFGARQCGWHGFLLDRHGSLGQKRSDVDSNHVFSDFSQISNRLFGISQSERR